MGVRVVVDESPVELKSGMFLVVGFEPSFNLPCVVGFPMPPRICLCATCGGIVESYGKGTKRNLLGRGFTFFADAWRSLVLTE